MKIVICGSMVFAKKMLKAKDVLEAMAHEVVVPRHTKEYANMGTEDHIHNESVKNKIADDLIRDYYKKIKENDAVLVINESKNNIANYIGGNSFLEIGFAYVLNKKIFLLNPIPDIRYRDEIEACRPIVINGDLGKIR
jgi:predicted RNA-binding protein with PUA domain